MSLLKVPHRQQRQEADCLAACARMVLEYYHINIRYARLLSILRVADSGATFRSLGRLESIGLRVQVERGAIDKLSEWLAQGVPPIVAVDTGLLLSYWTETTGHALVVISIDKQNIYVNDPYFADAPKKIVIDEFEASREEAGRLYAIIQPR